MGGLPLDPEINIMCLSAWGGTGKSMLVQSWLDDLRDQGWLGAERVFAWSFYSRGASEVWRASADSFFEDTMRWFDNRASSTDLTPWIKGESLAKLVMDKRTLLILDGLEPLQKRSGELREQGMKSLLRYLSTSKWNGLCLITSRVSFHDSHVRDFRMDAKRVRELKLQALSTNAGINLLKNKKLRGTNKAFRETVESVQGHALSLTLLGNALAELYDGELKQRSKIPLSRTNQLKSLMACYERMLESTPELMILYLMGLSDRALHSDIVEVLLTPDKSAWYEDFLSRGQKNQYEKLLSPIRNLDETERRRAFHHLQTLELIFKAPPGKADLGKTRKADTSASYAFDCHPLIHEYFGQRFEESWTDVWRMAHERLYNHYKDSVKEFPETLDEMEPLFAAVSHGCQAGKAQEAMNEIYWKRIRREDSAFTSKILGAIPSSLAVLSNFFIKTWTMPLSELDDSSKANVLNWAGFRLRALGRLEAAKEPLKISLAMYRKWKDWSKAAVAASNLAGLYLALGETVIPPKNNWIQK